MQDSNESGGSSTVPLDSPKPQPIEERITKKLQPEQSEAQSFQSEHVTPISKPVEPSEDVEPINKDLTDSPPTMNKDLTTASKFSFKKSKRGRQRSDERIKREVFFYLFATGHLDRLLGKQMINYYIREYTRKESPKYDKFSKWRKEYKQQQSAGKAHIPSQRTSYTRNRAIDSDRRVLAFRRRSS